MAGPSSSWAWKTLPASCEPTLGGVHGPLSNPSVALCGGGSLFLPLPSVSCCETRKAGPCGHSLTRVRVETRRLIPTPFERVPRAGRGRVGSSDAPHCCPLGPRWVPRSSRRHAPAHRDAEDLSLRVRTPLPKSLEMPFSLSLFFFCPFSMANPPSFLKVSFTFFLPLSLCPGLGDALAVRCFANTRGR